MKDNKRIEELSNAVFIDTGKAVPQEEQMLIICQCMHEILSLTAKGGASNGND